MKKLLLSFLSLLLVAGVAFASTETAVLRLGEHSDFNSWKSSYETHTLNYDIAKVTFNAASKQTGTITDCPVMKAGPARVTFTDGYQVTHIKFNFKQWTTKTKTLSLETYDPATQKATVMGITSSDPDLVIECDVNSNMHAVQVRVWDKTSLSGTNNQVGLESIEITYEVEDGDTREDVTLSFPEDSYSAILGQAFAAPELIGAPEGAEIVYTSSDEAVATVAADGTVTLVADGTTTITASFDGNDTFRPANATYTLKVVDPYAPVYLYKLVTDINDLNEGDIVTIACKSEKTVMTNADETNYRQQKSTVFYCNEMYLDNDDEIMQLELGKSGNNWTFRTINYKGTNGYIGNNNGSKNYCTINSTVTTGFAAAVTISANGNASIQFTSSSRNNLQYNATSGQERFSCYSSGQTAVQIYKRIAISMPLAAPTAEIAVNDVIIFSQDGFDVEFAISQSETDVPETFELHEEAIVLKNLNSGMNYIWAKTVVGPYESEAECIHVYENIDTEEAKEVACTYAHDGTMPQNNCWVVIGAEVNGKHYFMGPDGKATLATVADNQFPGYASHFNNTINEYRHIDGNLTIKPAAAHVTARAATNEGMTLTVADNGTATVTNAEGTLGFDAENKVFSTDAANKSLKVFATNGDVNTGVDNVATGNENAPVEYYNLQGVRIENPAKGGLYIKRQGTTVTKVAL